MFAALNRAVKENVTFAEAKEWGIGQRVERVTKGKATPPLMAVAKQLMHLWAASKAVESQSQASQ